jgi:hypothetical protein
MTPLSPNGVLTRPGTGHGRPQETPDWATAVALLKIIVKRLTALVRHAKKSAVQSKAQDRYTTEQVARLLEKKPRTAQKWCRDRQVNCIRLTRDGTYRITHEEIKRIRNHGLLPPGEGVVTKE